MAQAILVQARKRKNMICDITASVGDLVYLSDSIPNKIIVASDNNSPRPIIGIIIAKNSDTDVVILLDGVIKVGTIINIGKLFISTGGAFTLTDPMVNYTQLLGLSFGDGFIDFNPQLRIKRS